MLNMEADEIIKGIEHFFIHLLPKAYFSAEWDEDSIINAFHWAKFCEQVHKNYEDKPSKNKLDDLIHDISLNFKATNQMLCFGDLKKCINTISEAFFENPTVENSLIETVLLKIKNDKQPFDDMKEGPVLDSVCIELLEALKPIKIANSKRSLYFEIEAEIYLNVLKDATEHMTTEDQVEKYPSNALDKLCVNTTQMDLLLHALVIELPEETSLKEIQEFSINWIMYKIMSDKNSALSQFICEHPSKLRVISKKSSDFLNFYFDFLTECSSSLNCEVQDGETIWTQRFPKGNTLSFKDILIHFRCLLESDDDVCEYTKKHLLDLINSNTKTLIWKEILSRIT